MGLEKRKLSRSNYRDHKSQRDFNVVVVNRMLVAILFMVAIVVVIIMM